MSQKITSPKIVIMFIIFNLSICLLVSNDVYTVNNYSDGQICYEKLKYMINKQDQFEKTDIFAILNNCNNMVLFEMAELSAIDKNHEIMFTYIFHEFRRRVREGLEVEYFINEMTRYDLNSSYGCFLLRSIKSIYKNYDQSYWIKIYKVALNLITQPFQQTIEQKLAAIITTTTILSDLKAKHLVYEEEVITYCELLLSILKDNDDNDEIRRAAIKGLQYLNYEKSVNTLIEVISDNSIINNAPLARSACIALSRFREYSAIPQIKHILEKTDNEYIFISAALALRELGGRQSLQILMENEDLFEGKHCVVSVKTLFPLIRRILLDKDSQMLPYAIKATKYFYKKEHVDVLIPLLKALLLETNDKNVIKEVLNVFSQWGDRNLAKEIIEVIPKDSEYNNEINFFYNLANCIKVKSRKSDVLVEEPSLSVKGNTSSQEYGDAAYRDLPLFAISGLGHTGLYAGIDFNNNKRIIEVTGEVIGSSSWVVKDRPWSGMAGASGYWGANTLNHIDMTFSKRKNVMNTAVELIGYDIGYPFLAHDLLNHVSNPGTYVNPSEIDELRCDGLVEYCYEWNDYEVWGKNGNHYDVSRTEYVEEHNNLYAVWPNDPDEELAPVVQCGRAGGSSTHMIWAATTDLPTYNVGYTTNGSNQIITITATDRSGIHYIKYRVGSSGDDISSPVQPQHPTSQSYTYQFTLSLSQSEYVYFYAKDNGGNYPEYMEYIYVELPSLQVSPNSFNPSCTQGNNSNEQNFYIWNDGGGTLSYTISDNVSWLSCSPTSGSSTGETDTITVSYSTSGLSADTYYGTITVSASGATNSPQTISVNLTVNPPPPTIHVTPTSLNPSCNQGNNANEQNFYIWNDGGGTLSYTISDNVSWLSCSPTSGSSTGETDTITVSYSTSGLSADTYYGTITVSASGATNSPQTISVNLTVNSNPTPTIQLSTNTLNQSCDQGTNASNQSFTVRNSGDGTLNYTISDNVSWLSCSPTSGSSTGETDTITVSYSTSGLSADTYYGTITVSASGATNSPQTISVNLTVNSNPTPTIQLSTNTLNQSCDQGTNASNQSFTVRNSGDGTLNYTISDNVSWLSCSPTSGSSTGETDTITVSYSTSGLSADTYYGTITVSASGATNSPQTISVNLTVNSNPCSVTVNSPNGGETWDADSTHTITWDTSGSACGSYVKIELYKGGSFNSTIESSEYDNGSYSWDIPPSQTPGSDYKIKITDNSSGSYDFSNSYFTISEGSIVHCYDPPDFDYTITPTTTWQTTGTVSIEASECRIYKMNLNSNSQYNFSLCDDDGVGASCVGNGDFTMYDSSGTYLWYIDGNSSCGYDASTLGSSYEDWQPPTDDYFYLKVHEFQDNDAMTYNLAYKSETDLPLADLTPYKPSGWDDKLIISNVGGTHSDGTIYVNQISYIDWAVINDSDVDINNTFYYELWDDTTAQLIGTWHSDSLQAHWYAYLPDIEWTFTNTGWHTIRLIADAYDDIIESNEDNNEYTKQIYVNPVSICDIEITSPNGGESWYHGQQYNITWSISGSSCGSFVKIDLYKGGSFNQYLTFATENNGLFPWMPSSQSPGSDYQIKITDEYSGSYDLSGYFTIECPPPGSFTLSSPDDGHDFSPGTSSVSLQWNSSADATSYDVYFGTSSSPPLYDNVSVTSKIVSVSDGNTYYWKVQANNPCGSTWSSSGTWDFSVETSCFPPGSFTLSFPSDGYVSSGTSSLSLQWNSSANATSYDVYFGTSSSPPKVANTTYNDYQVSVSVGNTYYWKVQAINSCGSTWSSSGTWDFSVVAGSQHCYTPPSYDYTITPTSTWQTTGTVSIAASECRIYKMNLNSNSQYNFSLCDDDGVGASCDGDGDFTMYDSSGTYLWHIDGNSSCGYDASTIGTLYYYWQPPMDGYFYLKVHEYYNAAITYNLAYKCESSEPPQPPTNVNAQTGSGPGQIVLSWSSSSGATGYKIYYDEDSSNPPFTPSQNGLPSSGSDVDNVTQVTISGLTPGDLYYCAVVAYNSDGDSDYSDQDSATAGQDSCNLTVNSPNGGETWYRDSNYTITWDTSGSACGSVVKIELYKGGSWNRTIISSTFNVGSCSWNIPAWLSSGSDYQVKVTDLSSSAFDFSDANFMITEGRFNWFIPVANHTPGQNDTMWLSDVDVWNYGEVDVLVDMFLLKENLANLDPEGVTFNVKAGQAVQFADVLDTEFVYNNAGLAFRTSADTVRINSRLYNTASPCGGTFGMYIPAVGPQQAVTGPEVNLGLLHQLRYSTDNQLGFRTNIGFVNGSDFNVNFEIFLYDDDGDEIALYWVTAQPLEHRQFTGIHTWSPTPDLTRGTAIIKVYTEGGEIYPYAMVIDNISGDPMYMPAEVVSWTAKEDELAKYIPNGLNWFIPVANHTPGQNDTMWLSDIDIWNHGTLTAAVEMYLLKENLANPDPELSVFAAPAGEAVQLVDVLDTEFVYNNAGLAFWTSADTVRINSRLYNTASLCGGTFGMYIPAVGPAQAVKGPSVNLGLLHQLRYSTDNQVGFRTNIGFVNGSDFTVDFEIILYDDDGVEIASYWVTAKPLEHRQFTGIHTWTPTPDLTKGTAVIKVYTEGGEIYPYAMVIDNISGDPMYMPAETVD